MFMLMLSSSSPQDLLGVIFIFANMLLYLCSFFISLQLHSTSKYSMHGAFYISYILLFRSVTLKPALSGLGLHSFSQLSVHWGLQCQACAPSLIIPCLHSSKPPVLKASATVAGLYFPTLHHHVKVINISFFT